MHTYAYENIEVN